MNAESSITQWGDSLAICIPDNIAQEWGIHPGSTIEIIRRDDVLVLRKKTYDLATMLSQITDENLHREIDTGPPMGKEIW